MPNITTNKIRFKSKHKSKIRKVRDLLEGHECVVVDERHQSGTMSVFNVFDFNKIIPMPNNIFNVDLTEEERKSGKINWYDWRINNWGTKWNSIDAKVTYLSDTSIEYQFDTAWDCPRGIADVIKDFLPKGVEIDYWTCEHEQVNQETGEWIKETIFPKRPMYSIRQMNFEINKNNYAKDKQKIH